MQDKEPCAAVPVAIVINLSSCAAAYAAFYIILSQSWIVAAMHIRSSKPGNSLHRAPAKIRLVLLEQLVPHEDKQFQRLLLRAKLAASS